MVQRQYKRLSVKQIEAASKPGMYPDGDGLYLQVSRQITKSWIFRFKYDGKDRYMGLGSVRHVPLKEARDAVLDARRLLREGVNPIDERKAAKLEKARLSGRSKTFEQVARDFINSNEIAWRNDKHASQWSNTLRDYAMPVIGKLPMQAITTDHVLTILKPVWETKTPTATRVRERIEKVWNYAKTRGWCEGENPARWRGHLENALPKPAKIHKVEHHPALHYSKISAFVADLRKQDSVAALALEFMILTATRTTEVRKATWLEFDLEKALWVIPAGRTKNSEEHRVPLSDRAVAIVRQMMENRVSDFVFPGGRANKPLSENAMLALRKRMGRTDFVPHGLRSTFRVWAAEMTAYPREIAEQALGHKYQSAVEEAYARTDLLEKRRRLMGDWAAYCEQPAGGEVVPIRSGETA